MQFIILPGIEAKFIPKISGIYGYPSIVDGIKRDTLRIEIGLEEDEENEIGEDEIEKIKKYINNVLDDKYSTLRLFSGSFEYQGYKEQEDDHVNPDEGLPDIEHISLHNTYQILFSRFKHIMKTNDTFKEFINNFKNRYEFYSLGKGYTIRGPIDVITKSINTHSFMNDEIPRILQTKIITIILYKQTNKEWKETLKKYKESDKPEEQEIYELINDDLFHYNDINNLDKSMFYGKYSGGGVS